MPIITILLRVEQTRDDVGNEIYQDENVTIYAPEWAIKHALPLLNEKLAGTECLVGQWNGGPWVRNNNKIEQFTIENGKLTPQQLIMVARNQTHNTSGEAQTETYKNVPTEVIYSIKDLARHFVIIGKEKAVRYGGHRSNPTDLPQSVPVYVCDLSALQFQMPYNSGRLVIITPEGRLPKGELDDVIFENTVGEKKKPFSECKEGDRYKLLKDWHGNATAYFDTVAYQRFVTQDFILSFIALNKEARKNKEDVYFKFLNYGTGAFAGRLQGRDILEPNLIEGVRQGLEYLFKNKEHCTNIKCMVFPFFKYGKIKDQCTAIEALCKEHGIECRFEEKDALFPESSYPELKDSKRVMATTNCSDQHSPTGNEMVYESVDAAIAINTAGNCNKFSPVVNLKMKAASVSFSPPHADVKASAPHTDDEASAPHTDDKAPAVSKISITEIPCEQRKPPEKKKQSPEEKTKQPPSPPRRTLPSDTSSRPSPSPRPNNFGQKNIVIVPSEPLPLDDNFHSTPGFLQFMCNENTKKWGLFFLVMGLAAGSVLCVSTVGITALAGASAGYKIAVGTFGIGSTLFGAHLITKNSDPKNTPPLPEGRAIQKP